MPLELSPITRYAGGAPMYQQLADVIREAIVSHELAPGETLPSESTLAQRSGSSMRTARGALDILANEGLIIRAPGRPTRVAEPPPVRRMDASRYLAEMQRLRAVAGRAPDGGDAEHEQTSAFAEEHGVTLQEVTIDTDYTKDRATRNDADRLGVKVRSSVLRRQMLKYVRGVPVQIERSTVPYVIARGTVLEDPTVQPYPGGTQAELWSAGFQDLVKVTNEVQARMPSPDERRQLQLDAVVPVLDMVRTFIDADGPVEAARVIGPANRNLLYYEIDLA